MSPPSISSTGGSSRSNEASSPVTKEVDGKALAIQLAGTLLELSLTLAASYTSADGLPKRFKAMPPAVWMAIPTKQSMAAAEVRG
eukprot:scaffold17945_cov136-Skeletonema_dohrnii-CCMP3373.AAC.9